MQPEWGGGRSPLRDVVLTEYATSSAPGKVLKKKPLTTYSSRCRIGCGSIPARGSDAASLADLLTKDRSCLSLHHSQARRTICSSQPRSLQM
jgi:hypothetical protein